MSYQVLARKWRPKIFRETVGQEHVLRALINALDHDRLHHAYLFTGTRGVGKTTIARILAKCLNCEVGVSSEPCGKCSACVEIAEGRFVDLIEVDAASRTKVEDTRELLDNVQYTPTRGRYKVYLIDEVHMLSGHSFNALLKTLEEPPPYVKFLLATTDPQKLPATILSRCLQFHLKNMPPEAIAGHLQHVLEQEGVSAEESALWLLARAADGSMRDALSLTDQAIAFGSGQVRNADVRVMLGAIDQELLFSLVAALADADAGALLNRVGQLSEYGADFTRILDEVLALLHRIAVAQVVPAAADAGHGDAEHVKDLAGRLTAEEVQLYYQLGLLGRRDLPLSADPRAGLEMALLRMLAFRPQGVPEPPVRPLPEATPLAAPRSSAGGDGVASESVSDDSPPKKRDAAPAPAPSAAMEARRGESGTLTGEPIPGQISETETTGAAGHDEYVHSEGVGALPLSNDPTLPFESTASPMAEKVESSSLPEQEATGAASTDGAGDLEVDSQPISKAEAAQSEGPATAAESADSAPDAHPVPAWEELDAAGWIAVLPDLALGGVVGAIAAHCWLRSRTEHQLDLVLDEEHASLYNTGYRDRLAESLSEFWQRPVQVLIEVGVPQGETPAAHLARTRAEQRAAAREALEQDPNVQLLCRAFAATLDEDSVEPLL